MIPPNDLVTHMPRVQSGENDLRDLFVVWQMIESSAAISCPEAVAPILPALLRTRERFNSLRVRVIELMVRENLGALEDELAAKAQCAAEKPADRIGPHEDSEQQADEWQRREGACRGARPGQLHVELTANLLRSAACLREAMHCGGQP